METLEPTISWVESRWFEALPAGSFDLIVSNPPYVRTAEVVGALELEPRVALDGGADGLDAYRVLFAEAAARLNAGGALLVEHGAEQRPELVALAEAHGWRVAAAHDDLAGRPRVLELESSRAGRGEQPLRAAHRACRRRRRRAGEARPRARARRRLGRARLPGRAVSRDERHRPARVERLRSRRRDELAAADSVRARGRRRIEGGRGAQAIDGAESGSRRRDAAGAPRRTRRSRPPSAKSTSCSTAPTISRRVSR